MQRREIYQKFALGWVFSLLMIISLTAIAGSNTSRYSLQLAGGQSNPWALPQEPERSTGFQQPPKNYNQQYHGDSVNRDNQVRPRQNRGYQRNRFVTEEFLESLKRQQSQQQIMPENEHYLQPAPRSELRLPGSVGYPSYGMDYTDPMYDAPAVIPWSPWDIGLDNL